MWWIVLDIIGFVCGAVEGYRGEQRRQLDSLMMGQGKDVFVWNTGVAMLVIAVIINGCALSPS